MVEVRKLTATLDLAGNAVGGLGQFGLAVNGAKAALGAIVGTFKAAKAVLFDFTTEMAAQGDEIAKASKRIGITAESYQELSHAAELAGSSGAAVEKGIGRLAKNLSDAKIKGTGPFIDQLKAMNISFDEFKDLSPDEAFEKVADIVQQIPDEMDKMAFAQDALGRGGKELLPLLNQGSDAIRAQREEMRELGIMTNEQAADSEELVDAQLRLEKSIGGIKTIIAGELIPVTTEIITGIKDWILENRELITVKLREFIQDAVDAGRQLAPVIQDIAQAVSDLIPKLVEAAEEFGILLNQLEDVNEMLTESLGPAWEVWSKGVADSVVPLRSISQALELVSNIVGTLTEKFDKLTLAISPAITLLDKFRTEEGPRQQTRGLAGGTVQVASIDATAAQRQEEANLQAFKKMVDNTDDLGGLRGLAANVNVPTSVRVRARKKLERLARKDLDAVNIAIAGNTLNSLRNRFGSAEEVAADVVAPTGKPKKKRRRGGGGKAKRAAAEAVADEPLTDEELLTLVNKAAAEGKSLTGLIGDRKVPTSVPPVITVTINKFEQDIDINAPVTVNGVPGTAAEEVASIAVSRFKDELGKAIADAKEDLAPVQAI